MPTLEKGRASRVDNIFLSTVSDEFRAYRDQLRGDLTRHNVAVKVQEDFKDLGGDTLDKLDTYIAYCDGVVHLIGDMTGAAADETQQQALLGRHPDLAQRLTPLAEALKDRLPISYTQWEAWLTLYYGKPLLIAKAATTAPREGPGYAPTDDSRAAQSAHLARLKAVHRYPGCEFVSPDDLAKHIAYSAILDLLVRDEAERREFDRGYKVGLSKEDVRQALREELARERGLDPEVLRPIFDNLGELGLSREQLLEKAEQGIAALLARARVAVAPTNDGDDIDATIAAARDKLRGVDTRAAREILSNKIAEEESERRRRLAPLLLEQAAIERASFDYDSAKATLRRLLAIEPDRVWSWIDLGDICVTTGGLESAMQAYRGAVAAAERLLTADPHDASASRRDLSVSFEQGWRRACGAGGFASGAEGVSRRSRRSARSLSRADPGNAGWRRDLSVSYDQVGDVLVAQGDLPRGAESVSRRSGDPRGLVARRPRQRGLAARCLGVVRQGRRRACRAGGFPEALKSFRDSRRLRKACRAPTPATRAGGATCGVLRPGWRRAGGAGGFASGAEGVSRRSGDPEACRAPTPATRAGGATCRGWRRVWRRGICLKR